MEKEVLFNNYDLDNYVEMAREDNEHLTEDELYDMAYDVMDMEWENLYEYLRNATEGKYCIMNGTVERWNGTSSGWDCNSFQELFSDIMKDCQFWKFYCDEDDTLCLECSHHDGTNVVEFILLTDEGYEKYDEWSCSWSWNNDVPAPKEFLDELLADKSLWENIKVEW